MADFIIIGGGLIGMLSAYELAQSGASVVIYERQSTGTESSWAGGGILSPLYPWRYPDAVTALARWSQEHYPSLAEQLSINTGIDPEWQQSGLLMLNIDDKVRVQALEWADCQHYTMTSPSDAEVRALQPGIGDFTENSLWMPAIAQLRNPCLLKALRKQVESMGVAIHEHMPVTGIVSDEGKVYAIECGSQRIIADKVIVTGGAWSSEILKNLGVEIPVEPVRGQMLLFRAEPEMLSRIILSDEHYVIPRRDGRILVGSTLEYTGFDKSTTEHAREELMAHAFRIFPPLERYQIERHWAGLRPGSKDGIPLIGCVPGHNGLYVNTGHFRNGVVMGFASARLLADLLLERAPSVNPTPYALKAVTTV